MARTEQKVGSLIGEDPELAEAIELVYERTDGGTAAVQWDDVRDELTSGQWGRLIQIGILTDGETGFVLDDPDGVAEALGESEEGSVPESADVDDENEESGWSSWDKAAALGSVALFAGYWTPEVRNVIGGAMDLLIGPLEQTLPFYAVVMTLALFTGLYSTLLQANLMDMDEMSKYQARMKEIQQRQKEAKERGDDEALEEIRQEQMEAMGDQLGMFKLQFRPMVWIMLLTIPAFLWMYWKIGARGGTPHGSVEPMIMPLVGEAAWTQGVVGPIQTWIVWYFVCSMAFTQIIRKGLNIQTSPT